MATSSPNTEILKTFAQNVTTSSTKERIRILCDVKDCVQTNDFPEAAVKGILKFLVLTLGRYRDGRSVKAVADLVQILAQKYPEITQKNIQSSLNNFSEAQKKIVLACRSSSGEALVALTWTCISLKQSLVSTTVSASSLKQMVNLQTGLIYGAVAAENGVINQSTFRKMKPVWSHSADVMKDYIAALQEMEPSIFNFSSIALIMKYLTSVKDTDTISKHKNVFLEQYLKHVLASRTKPPVHILKSCSELLRQCTHDDFRTLILPAVKKAMLRSPEICLETVGYLIKGLKLDLSQYSTDLSKLLGAQLCSRDETTKKEALQAVRNLASQCSDPGAVEQMVSHMFGVLGGSEVKLTLTDQKICILQAVGNLFYNTVSGTTSLQNLSSTVAELFLPTLQQEAHEGTLVHALSMLSLWCTKFYTQVPEKLCQWFKKGITLKTSTSAVRNAYILCMNASFHGDTLPLASEMLPFLMQTVEKANKQSNQAVLITEAISAANILVRLSLVDIDAESKLTSFWTTVLDEKKQLLNNVKFMSQASEETLQNLVTLSERLILEFPQLMNETVSRPYYRVLVFCLTRRSWVVRKHTRNSINRILSLLGGATICLSLIEEFRIILQTQTLADFEKIKSTEDDIKENGFVADIGNVIPPKIVADALLTVCSVEKVDVKDAESIAMATIQIAHHPYIGFSNNSAWIDILRKLKVDPANFVRSHTSACLKDVKTGEKLTETLSNALSMLVLVSPDEVLKLVMNYVTSLLDNPAYTNITQEEYAIFLTPDGELYDKSLLENAKKCETRETNVRRENKLYSYADQMAELELKKLHEKKMGKKEEMPKLTKKQEELLQAQKQREAEIRNRLREFDRQISCACSILSVAIKSNEYSCCLYMKEVCRLLVPLLQSPLAAPTVAPVFVQLGHSAFENKHLGSVISNGTLRLMHPACEVNSEWTCEREADHASRLVTLLVEEGGLPLYTFAFVYYLMRCVLLNGGQMVLGNSTVCSQALELISSHSQMRSCHDDDSGRVSTGSEFDPELLPRTELLTLVLNVLSTMAGSIQQVAATALIAIAESADGGPGAGKVTEEEIKVLLGGLQSPGSSVRDASLQCLQTLVDVLPNVDSNFELGLNIASRIWIACNDEEEHIKKLAECVREELNLEEPIDDLPAAIVEDITHDEEVVRKAASDTISQVLEIHNEFVPVILQQLLARYEEKLYMPPPKLDQFGRLIEEQPPDMWTARSGIALALGKMAALVPVDEISNLFAFYVPNALGDRSIEVRSQMRDAALAAINVHGKDNVNILLPVFENFLATAPDTAQNDTVRQSIIILMGTLAKHLDSDNPKVKPIVAQLISALSTPSQEVQEAVANCLPPLVASIKQDAPDLVQRLLHLLLESDNYGERKGAAYGLAGLIKGMGLLALKQQKIMDILTAAIQDKKNPRKREGALFAFEMLCNMLGRLFEPYIVNIIQHLLLCFGDNSQYVRQAADDCAKSVMRNLSAHGVKLVLPALLRGLEEDSWRTKTGSVELLGAMAFCAPKQLSACLPNIVPKLTEVLTDSHAKVQKSGSQALMQIGSVIRNPEIQAIVPILIDALQEPTIKTTTCLQKLLATKFVHFVDAPSLALIMPVIQRAFQDRTTDTRKMAAQIMGNMYSLTDQKDLSPYLPSVIPGLKQCLLDPVPEVRSVSARALGAMVKGMGESSFDDLLPWLMEKLVSESSSVDRSGAAQGLSEVIGGVGFDKLQKVMPDIIATAEKDDLAPHVRDGYIMTYIYLPATFGKDFGLFVGPILPSILKALADESEYVRDTALRAGQRIINLFADTAIELLLPEIERGLFDDNWRIRYSSVQLLGDLLYKISGVTGKMSTESAGDDDNFGTDTQQGSIMSALGEDRRNRVLAGLYMGRSDTALLVRQSALHVWKIIVSNTPKMLKEILPTMFSLLLGCLASTCHDKRTVAARTLGDLVRKLGERVLPEIIPILECGLESDEKDQRQGVCIGLSEIMASTSKEHVMVFADSLIPTVRKALCDQLPEVREAAARTFDSLHHNIGQRALDEILPDLLKKLEDPELHEMALDGLTQVMSVKSKVVLPYLVPQLTTPPVNTKALSLLSSVAGDALTKHLGKILPALMSALAEKIGTLEEEQELYYCKTVVLAIEDHTGLRTIMEDLMGATKTQDHKVCSAAVTILHAFCKQTNVDFSDYIPQLFRTLISLFTRTDSDILLSSWNCLDAITKKLDTTEMLQHISNVRQSVRYAVSDFSGSELPGFSIPKKGITPVLPIFREGILNGSPEMKESAANGLGEVINYTSPEALKPSVVNITGPLIRILGDRFSWNVKVAVLETLTLLLAKVGMMLKPFLPQLQTTFLKALNDPHRSVRLKAAAALGKLIIIHTRVDPLFTELQSGIKNADDTSVRDTMLQALRYCLMGAGGKVAEGLRRQITTTLKGLLTASEDSTRMVSAGCMGELCNVLPEAELTELIIQDLLDLDASLDWTLRHGRSMALGVAIKNHPEQIWTPAFKMNILKAVGQLAMADRIPICLSGLRCAGYIMRHQLNSSDDISVDLIGLLNKGMKHDSNDVKQLIGQIVIWIAQSFPTMLPSDLIRQLIPLLVNGTKERNTLVRANSELALVALLHLRTTEKGFQDCLATLDSGMQDSLREVMNKSLKKHATQTEPRREEIDDTLLT